MFMTGHDLGTSDCACGTTMFMTGPRSRRQRWRARNRFRVCMVTHSRIASPSVLVQGMHMNVFVRYIVTGCVFCALSGLVNFTNVAPADSSIQYCQIFGDHLIEETHSYRHVWKFPENILKYLYGEIFEMHCIMISDSLLAFNTFWTLHVWVDYYFIRQIRKVLIVTMDNQSTSTFAWVGQSINFGLLSFNVLHVFVHFKF